MSDIKSYQRFLAVQAIYETSINKKEADYPFEQLLSHIIENADFKNKINSSKLSLTKAIYNGVFSNLKKIDTILTSSLKTKRNDQSLEKLLLSIFRCAIYEIVVKKEISKKIVISEYLMISNHFFGIKEATLLNGVLDNLIET
jgi:N utilization substance protein B